MGPKSPYISSSPNAPNCKYTNRSPVCQPAVASDVGQGNQRMTEGVYLLPAGSPARGTGLLMASFHQCYTCSPGLWHWPISTKAQQPSRSISLFLGTCKQENSCGDAEVPAACSATMNGSCSRLWVSPSTFRPTELWQDILLACFVTYFRALVLLANLHQWPASHSTNQQHSNNLFHTQQAST